MKMSPFYKSFEEEATQWDNRLHNMRNILDVWQDVQRRWVYLEAIFFGSADIQSLLTQEYNQFKQIDSEFLGNMKKVA